jgi:hypothetical protein
MPNPSKRPKGSVNEFPSEALENHLHLEYKHRFFHEPTRTQWYTGSTVWVIQMADRAFVDATNNYHNTGIGVTNDEKMAKYAIRARWLVQSYVFDQVEKTKEQFEWLKCRCDLERDIWCGVWIERQNKDDQTVGSSLNCSLPALPPRIVFVFVANRDAVLLEAYKRFLEETLTSTNDRTYPGPKERNFDALYTVVDNDPFLDVSDGKKHVLDVSFPK